MDTKEKYFTEIFGYRPTLFLKKPDYTEVSKLENYNCPRYYIQCIGTKNEDKGHMFTILIDTKYKYLYMYKSSYILIFCIAKKIIKNKVKYLKIFLE